jgi:hypothetical protein
VNLNDQNRESELSFGALIIKVLLVGNLGTLAAGADAGGISKIVYSNPAVAM